MATTRISKIKIRQGNFSDLPLLGPGEMGYAKDVRRLFIGNDTVNIGTGNGVLTQFTIPLSLSKPNITAIFVAGTQQNASTYTLSGTTITFSSAPTGAITARFNSEIEVDSDVTIPSSIELAANGSSADTGFQIDTRFWMSPLGTTAGGCLLRHHWDPPCRRPGLHGQGVRLCEGRWEVAVFASVM